jgi:uncharacterized protein (DUF4415 family)
MKTKSSTVRPSPLQLDKLQDTTQEDAPFRASLGTPFWRGALPLYPTRGKRLARIRLDPEVSDWFRMRKGADQDAINAVLRAYVEAKKAEE